MKETPLKDYWVQGRLDVRLLDLFDDMADHGYGRDDGNAALIELGMWDLADAWTNYWNED